MSLRKILAAIKAFVLPQEWVYRQRTYGQTRVWDEHGNELDPTDPRYIKIKRIMDAHLRESMKVVRKRGTIIDDNWEEY